MLISNNNNNNINPKRLEKILNLIQCGIASFFMIDNATSGNIFMSIVWGVCCLAWGMCYFIADNDSDE